MSVDAVTLVAAVLQGLSKVGNEPITAPEAVHRARLLYLEAIRQLRDQTHTTEIPS
jgi:hypothetical protein